MAKNWPPIHRVKRAISQQVRASIIKLRFIGEKIAGDDLLSLTRCQDVEVGYGVLPFHISHLPGGAADSRHILPLKGALIF